MKAPVIGDFSTLTPSMSLPYCIDGRIILNKVAYIEKTDTALTVKAREQQQTNFSS